jgi:hypothetical protein
MVRSLAPWLVGAAVFVVGWAVSPADTGSSPPVDSPPAEHVHPRSDPSNEPDMDHEGKRHHHHQHRKDHNGADHAPGGMDPEHHHHHPHGPHPHPVDPHHHHAH